MKNFIALIAALWCFMSPGQTLAVDFGALSKTPVPAAPERFDRDGFAKIAEAVRGVQELEDNRLEDRARNRAAYSSNSGGAVSSDSISGSKDSGRKPATTPSAKPNSGGAVSSDSISGSNDSGRKPATTPSAKRFSCKIYCNSASGPTIRREFAAANRKAAATQAEEAANSLCRQDGYKGSSSDSFSESQCSEQ